MSSTQRKVRRSAARALGRPAETASEWHRERAILCSAIGNVSKSRWRYKRLLADVNAELERLGAGFAIGPRD